MYAQNFRTGQKWTPAVVKEVTGPVSFLVKLQDGRLIRSHVDHLRHRALDVEAASDDMPEIFIDSGTVASISSETGQTKEAADTRNQE